MTSDWRAHGLPGPGSFVIAVGLAPTAALPPAEAYARQSAFVEGAAVRGISCSDAGAPRAGPATQVRIAAPAEDPARPAVSGSCSCLAAAAVHDPGRHLAAAPLLGALARYPALSAAELVTLVTAGLGVRLAITWAERLLEQAERTSERLRAVRVIEAGVIAVAALVITGWDGLERLAGWPRLTVVSVIGAAVGAGLAALIYLPLEIPLRRRQARDSRSAVEIGELIRELMPNVARTENWNELQLEVFRFRGFSALACSICCGVRRAAWRTL